MTRLKVYLRHHAQALRATLVLLARAPLATLMTIAVLGITLALPAGLYLAVDNFQRISTNWDTGGQASLFLKLDISDVAAEKLAERIRHMRGVGRVEYRTRAQALAEFKQISGFGDALSSLDRNPLPAVIIVHPTKSNNAEATETLFKELRSLDAVDSAQLDLEWVRRLQALLSVAERVILVLACLLGLAVLLTVGNTIRLAVLNRRDEIEVEKLIGATNAFIRRPFLYSGLAQGALGAAAAMGILVLTLMFLAGPLKEVAQLYGTDFDLRGLSFKTIVILLLVGTSLGWLGSRIAVGRHLRAIEPS